MPDNFEEKYFELTTEEFTKFQSIVYNRSGSPETAEKDLFDLVKTFTSVEEPSEKTVLSEENKTPMRIKVGEKFILGYTYLI